MKKDEINLYWSKRKAQYKALEAAYKQKELVATVAAEIDDEVISKVVSKKRKIAKKNINENKKQRVSKGKIEEMIDPKNDNDKDLNQDTDTEVEEEAGEGGNSRGICSVYREKIGIKLLIRNFIARRYVLDYNEVNSTDLAKLTKHKISKKRLTVEERL